MTHVLFIPGAGGAASFWHPLGKRLPAAWRKTYLNWPGAGNERHDPTIRSFADYARFAAWYLDAQGSVVIAQSMGGIIGVRLALQYPQRVTHLVLAATSGGLNMGSHGAADWRRDYRAEYPRAAEWITAERPDHESEIGKIEAACLLLWGDADPISPPNVGRHLQSVLRNARLHVVEGGDHAFARDRAAEIAPLVAAHIAGAPTS